MNVRADVWMESLKESGFKTYRQTGAAMYVMRRKNIGICAHCGSRKARKGRLYCSQCAQIVNAGMARLRSSRKLAGLCVKCGDLSKNKSYCCHCARNNRAKANREYRRRRAAGLCGRCNKAAKPGLAYCDKHLMKMLSGNRRTRSSRRESGVCTECGKQPRNNHVLCESCARRSADKGNRANAQRRMSGRCMRCKSPALKSRSCCRRCLDRLAARARDQANKDNGLRRSAARKRWTDRVLSLGLCRQCGHQPEPGRTHCRACLKKKYDKGKSFQASGRCRCGRKRACGRKSCVRCLKYRRKESTCPAS